MRDISSRQDIEHIMQTFYTEALVDPIIGDFFTKIARLHLEEHLPEITDFWEQQLFRKGRYQKNVLQIHLDLNDKKKFEEIHFQTWLALFNKAIDQNFEGDLANLMKTRALSIATVMRIKMQ